jgi:hypothetical protein
MKMLKKSMKNTEKEQLIICVPINFITLKNMKGGNENDLYITRTACSFMGGERHNLTGSRNNIEWH